MNRKYTAESYLEIVEAFRKHIPNMTFSTDLLIGFPGETEKDLDDTFRLMQQVRFTDAFTYFYNPRKGTQAERMSGQIDDAVKHARLKHVIELQKEISHEEKMRRIGSVEQVLVESVSKKNDNELLARTEHDDMVLLPKSGLSRTEKGTGAAAGEMHTAVLKEMRGNTFLGNIVR
jgi:tRNA-2-methylthio-N6-dimethylallyladenosine synthase